MTAPPPDVPAEGFTVPAESVSVNPKPGYAQNRNRLATLAVLATFLCGALPGFVLGVVALIQIYDRGQQGKGQAWTAVILSGVITIGAAVLVILDRV
jgi:hypothetical protein